MKEDIEFYLKEKEKIKHRVDKDLFFKHHDSLQEYMYSRDLYSKKNSSIKFSYKVHKQGLPLPKKEKNMVLFLFTLLLLLLVSILFFLDEKETLLPTILLVAIIGGTSLQFLITHLAKKNYPKEIDPVLLTQEKITLPKELSPLNTKQSITTLTNNFFFEYFDPKTDSLNFRKKTLNSMRKLFDSSFEDKEIHRLIIEDNEHGNIIKIKRDCINLEKMKLDFQSLNIPFSLRHLQDYETVNYILLIIGIVMSITAVLMNI